MKDAKMLVWLSQLGLSALMPPAGCILFSVWLQKQYSWGNWIVILGVILGVICGVQGFISTLKAADKLQKKKEDPPVSFNEHE